MKKLILLVTLISAPAFAQQAQQTPEQRTIELLSQDMGALHGQIAALVARLEAANKKVQELTPAPAKTEEKK